MSLTETSRSTAADTASLVAKAVTQNPVLSRQGLRERTFAFAFQRLVYPQIWEDPLIDMEAMALDRDSRVLSICSGGCNALSYLSGSPASVTAIDLNSAHVSLARLKIAALKALPTHHLFHRFFALADQTDNVALYDSLLRYKVDAMTRAYFDGRDAFWRRRITAFGRGFYRYGLLGRFIGLAHLVARFVGVHPREILKAQSLEEQQAIFDVYIAPSFERGLIPWLLAKPASLYGLGIPPQQYEALAEGRPMSDVVKERLHKLACGFPLKDNYFAWQAFNRGYERSADASLPPYLQSQHFETLKANAERIDIVHGSYTDHLKGLPKGALNRFVLLDAQDWMDDATLTELWTEITRVAGRGARVIFRTAGVKTILPGRIPQDVLARWDYREAESLDWTARDRSAIYGGFHLYCLKDA